MAGSGWDLTLVAGGAVALLFAAVVLIAAPSRTVNRLLSLFLALLGWNYAADGLARISSDWVSYNLNLQNGLTWAVVPFAYLLFVGVAIDTPLARPLRRTSVRALLVAGAILFAIDVAIVTVGITSSTRLPDGSWSWQSSAPPWMQSSWVAFGTYGVTVAFGFGLLASLDAWRRAPVGSVARRRARSYAIAFGVQDAGFVIVNLLTTTGIVTSRATYNVIWTIPLVVALALLARALLREQLFDFELKLKWTVRRGTVVAAFVAAFLIASQLAEIYLQDQGLIVGGVTAGLLLFALRPIERAADRLADAAMPRVQDNEEYRTVRKREVYRAAIESALEDGEVTEKERGVLATLADQLGLGAKDALDIEREARATAS